LEGRRKYTFIPQKPYWLNFWPFLEIELEALYINPAKRWNILAVPEDNGCAKIDSSILSFC